MSEIQIRAALADYLAERISLDLLEELAVGGSWEDGPGSSTTEFAATISNLLAEFDGGAFDELSLRGQLSGLAAPWMAGVLVASTASSSEVVTAEPQLSWWQLAGTRRVAEPA
jgi:hypothetical protein